MVNRIDEKVYGHFLEHIYHSCNGGLWGELVWDRSFEGGGAGVAWTRQDDCIAQEGAAADVRLLFGDPQWTDYEFTVEARKTGGDEGFLILVRALNDKEFYWANFGGWGNVGHALERGIQGQNRWGAVTRRRNGQIETGRWYRVRARCEGPRVQFWLDDELVIDYTDDGRGPARGRAGVGTWVTQTQFRNFQVTSLDGTSPARGTPAAAQTGNGRRAGLAAVRERESCRLDRQPAERCPVPADRVGRGIGRAGAATAVHSRRRGVPRFDLGAWRSCRRARRAVGGRWQGPGRAGRPGSGVGVGRSSRWS